MLMTRRNISTQKVYLSLKGQLGLGFQLSQRQTLSQGQWSRERGATSHLKMTVTPGAGFKEFTSIFKITLLTTFEMAEPHPQNTK